MAQGVRLVLSDEQWQRIENLCVGKPEDPGGTGADNRLFVEAVLWIARTGSPWRDLPPLFGKWNSVFVRFNRWSEGGVWRRIFAALSDDPDFEYLIIDSTIVRAHQHATGAKGGLKIRRKAPLSMKNIISPKLPTNIARRNGSASRCTSGAAFTPGGFLPIALSVWDGFSRERGNRRGLTVWHYLYVEPEVVPSAVGPMVRTALFILAIELVVIGWMRRWHHGSRARGDLGGEPRRPATTRA